MDAKGGARAGVAGLVLSVLIAGCAPAPGAARDVSARRHGLYRSDDFGRTWAPADSALPGSLRVVLLEPWGERLVVGTEAHGLFVGVPGRGAWIASGDALPGPKITALHAAGDTLYAGVFRQGMFASTDGGRSWNAIDRGLPDRRVRAILSVDDGLIVGTDTGIFRRRHGDATWAPVFRAGQVVSLDRNGSSIVGGGVHGTVLSADEGRTWRWIHRDGAAHGTAVIDDRIVLMNISGDLWISADRGAQWTAQDYAPRAGSYVYDVEGSGSRLVASNNYGIHASADSGRHWALVFPTEAMVFLDLVRAADGTLYGGTSDWKERRPRTPGK